MGTRSAHVLLNRSATETVRRGHPWVFRSTGLRIPNGLPSGADVRVLGFDESLLGHGLHDATSPICIRMFTHDETPIDGALFGERIARAFALRESLFDVATTNAYRLLHGEGDRLPGFVVDRYDHVAVIRTDGDAAAARLAEFVDPLLPSLERLGIHVVGVRHAEKGKPPRWDVLKGGAIPETVTVREHGVPFVVDVAKGQKTGAFLDQRENRKRVGELARDRRVLNLFSYAGGFSLHAAKGGARHVTSVDIATSAHVTAMASFRAAGLEPKGHEFVTADCFAYLTEAEKKGKSWDVVISDPPSFAPSEKALPRALAAYRALHRAAARVLAPGGIFCASSCSSHVSADAFAETLDDVTLEHRGLRLLESFGPPADHPTLAAWPEGRYLKFFVLT